MSLFTACKDTPTRPEAILDANYEPTVPTTSISGTTTGDTGEPAQNASGVWHYTCSTGCSGGAGSAVPCATCGQTLVHNTQYHDNQGASNPSNTIGNDGGISLNNPMAGGLTPPATKAPEPPQNAAGVWHYICDAGCAGGAGSATACAGCGNTLSHNTAYHN